MWKNPVFEPSEWTIEEEGAQSKLIAFIKHPFLVEAHISLSKYHKDQFKLICFASHPYSYSIHQFWFRFKKPGKS